MRSSERSQEGKNADYIPALAKVDPTLFGIAVVTADGKVYTAGDVKTEVSIQSISKVFTMAQVIQEQGLESIEKQIGVDATGARFNSIIAVEGVRTVVGSGAPEMNPLVNPGAISATSMVRGATADEVWKKIIGFHNDAAGRQLTVLQDVYKSESDTNQRNQAIGALMLAYGYIKNNWQQAVDLYTRQCSIGVNAKDLAMMAATLAAGGKNPVTGKQVIDAAKVPGVLAVMATAGLYDDSGKWLYHTGLPAKSGVGGGIIAVSPGKFGIAVVSPPLDEAGNSVRAQRAITDISNALGGNPYAPASPELKRDEAEEDVMSRQSLVRTRWAAAVAATVLCLTLPAGAQTARPRIVIVATGGTIAGAAESTTAAGYKSGAVAVDVLIAAVPQMKKFADVRGVQVASVGSQDMNDELWVKLATEVNDLLAQPDVDGVAITHGTDTMEETAYFLNLVVKSDKPVVLTGSMRPSTSLSADGPLNIYNAVGVASDPRAKGRGVLVVANDDIHGARDDHQAAHHRRRDLRLARGRADRRVPVRRPRVRRARRRAAHTTATPFKVATGQTLPRVDIIYAHAGMSPDLIDAAVANGAKGLVIAGVGDGNMTTPALEAVKRAIAKGVVVVRSSRVGDGIIRRNIEVDDDKVGTVASMELNPSKARVLLKLALTQTSDAEEGPGVVRQVLRADAAMDTGIAGWIVDTLRAHPELAVFFALARRVRGRGVEGGRLHARQRDRDPAGRRRSSASWGSRSAGPIKSTFFLMFLFAVGFGVGPQFFRGLGREGPRQIAFSLIVLALCLGGAGAVRDLRRPGRRLRGRALRRVADDFGRDRRRDGSDRPAGISRRRRRKAYADAIPIGYAVTYIFGTIGSAIVLAQLGPKLIGVDLRGGLCRVRATARRGLGADSMPASCPPIAQSSCAPTASTRQAG